MFGAICFIIIAWCVEMPLAASIAITVLSGIMICYALVRFFAKIEQLSNK